MLNKKSKLSFFGFLLLSTVLFPSAHLAYADPLETLIVTEDQTLFGIHDYSGITITGNKELIIDKDAIVSVVDGNMFNLGTIIVDGIYKHSGDPSATPKTGTLVGNGDYFIRCGIIELEPDIQMSGTWKKINGDECSNELPPPTNNIVLDNQVFTIDLNRVVYISEDLLILGEFINNGLLVNSAKITLEDGIFRNFGQIENNCSNLGNTISGSGVIQLGDVKNIICERPNAVNDNYSVEEDNPGNILFESVIANDSDDDNSKSELIATATNVSQESGIVMMNEDGTFGYQPALNFNGNDKFEYTLTDPTGGTDSATVFITVTPVNDPPTANAQTVAVDEDSSKDIVLTGNDIDGKIILFTIDDDPAYGSLSGTAPDVTYAPNADYVGPDSFTFTVTDNDESISLPETITIDVSQINDKPEIKLIGDTSILLKEGDTYDEQGATCVDPEEDDISDKVIIGGLPDGTVVDEGVYPVTYDCEDTSGLDADQVSRIVNVRSNDDPEILMNGDDSIEIILGEEYTDAGATYSDTEDGDGPVVEGGLVDGNDVTTDIVSDVNPASEGSYTVEYFVTDSDGNPSQEVRTVHVMDESSNSLRVQTIDEIMKLEDLIDEANDKKTKDEINKALKELNKSVETEKWEDNGNYLIDNKGKKVFDEQQKGVKHIIHILDKNKETKEFLSKVTSISLTLIDIDEELSGNEFTIAEESPESEQKCLDDAEKELKKSDKEEQKGKYDKAIDHLGHLWEKSLKCQGIDIGGPGHGPK